MDIHFVCFILTVFSLHLPYFVFLGTCQAPKVGSNDKHRLMYLLYQSNEQITATPIIEQEKRRQFPLKQSVEENKLNLLSATAFTIDGTTDK
jgi:hypothetical protein